MIQCEQYYKQIQNIQSGGRNAKMGYKIVFIKPGTKLQLTFHGLVCILKVAFPEVAFPDETYRF